MAKNKPLKLVIDTNLWISFIISKKLNLLDSLLIDQKARILFSAELITEIQETIKKPKLRKYFVNNALEEMLWSFDPFIDFVEVVSKVIICRDAKDNFLLALAKDGKADFLLTGDNDLHDLKSFGETKIKSVSTFIKEFGNY